MAFSSILKKTGVIGDISYAIYSYSAASVTTGAIKTPKGILHVAWTPATVRASSTINYTTTDGTITLDGLTSNDTGYVMVLLKGAF
jgi:hypothetical protein